MTGKITFKLPSQKEAMIAAMNAVNVPICKDKIDQLFLEVKDLTETDREQELLDALQQRIDETFKFYNL